MTLRFFIDKRGGVYVVADLHTGRFHTPKKKGKAEAKKLLQELEKERHEQDS